jgi:hypothetical protein
MLAAHGMGAVRGWFRRVVMAVDGWTRKHWQAGGGSVVGWTVAILLVGLIVAWGVTQVGLPWNPADEVAALATAVASPQSKDPTDVITAKRAPTRQLWARWCRACGIEPAVTAPMALNVTVVS